MPNVVQRSAHNTFLVVLCPTSMSSAPSTSSAASAPTTRSRTLLFISYRDSSARSSRFARTAHYDDAHDEREGLIDSGPGHISLDVQLPPKWYVFAVSVARLQMKYTCTHNQR